MVIVLMGVGGCVIGHDYVYRHPCEKDDESCCPPHSHEYVSTINPDFIICVADEAPCVDAGADTGECVDAK